MRQNFDRHNQRNGHVQWTTSKWRHNYANQLRRVMRQSGLILIINKVSPCRTTVGTFGNGVACYIRTQFPAFQRRNSVVYYSFICDFDLFPSDISPDMGHLFAIRQGVIEETQSETDEMGESEGQKHTTNIKRQKRNDGWWNTNFC